MCADKCVTVAASLVFTYDSRLWLKASSNRQLRELWRECERRLKVGGRLLQPPLLLLLLPPLLLLIPLLLLFLLLQLFISLWVEMQMSMQAQGIARWTAC